MAYIAAVANRFPYTADISPRSLVAFGSHKLVSLWNLADENIHATLPGHEGVVTCIRFASENIFVSGDDNGVLRCWEKSGSQVAPADFGLCNHDIPLLTTPFLVVYETKSTSTREVDILHGILRRLPHHGLVELNCKGLDYGYQGRRRHANCIVIATPVC